MPASLSQLRDAMPAGGMFAGRDWLASPEPFPLDAKLWREIERLGYRLQVFLRACNDLYYLSHKGRRPAWIASLMDAGKPPELLEAARHPAHRQELPGVIRPDLLVTEEGLSLTEIDSVPGGIGLTAWLGQTYAALDSAWQMCGGADGMVSGFRSLFPGGADIAVSREAGDYRPEMEWLAGQLGAEFSAQDAETYAPRGRDVYRFFELFDLANISRWRDLATPGQHVSAPMKPWLEEKLWLALFWSRPLRDVWREMLRENQRDALAKLIPFGWVVDPAPLPPHGVLPRLDVHSWDELAAFSQKERQLVLKLSGFSDQAWGSRSVVVGHDVSQVEWRASLTRAQEEFPQHPWIIQEFRHARLVEHPYFDPATGALRVMQGRVRLCPYYFVPRGGGDITCGGVLATIVPADKKIIHGMKDGIIVPCRVSAEG
jgi:hypothetical protein